MLAICLSACTQTDKEPIRLPVQKTVLSTLELVSNAAKKTLPNCSTDIDEQDIIAKNSLGNTGVFVCKGTLYLFDISKDTFIAEINESWWFEELNSFNWQDDNKRLHLSANFITGIGPTGVVTFAVNFLISQQADDTWLVEQSEEKNASSNAQFQVQEDGMVEITNTAQLNALNLTQRGKPVLIDLDFEKERLVVMSVWLTSGSAKITRVNITRNNRAYFVTYDTHYPKIGTMDMKRSIIYLILPKDIRYVSFEEHELDARKYTAQYGIIDSGNHRNAPLP